MRPLTGGRYRSYFWPAVLILAGLLALLVNTGVVSVDRLYRLGDLWPLILVVIGLELIARRAFQGGTAELAGVLIVVLAVGGAAVYVALGPSTLGGTQTLDVTEPVGSLDQASVEVNVGAASITMSGGNALDTALFHAHLEYSGSKPDVSLDRSSGTLHISQGSHFNFFQNRRFVLDLRLNPNVKWTITENSGSTTDTLNLAHIQVGSITLDTGASRDDITLGKPSGIADVTINGGALTVHLHRPSGTAASVAVAGGAVSLNADGRQMHAIGDLTFESPGFSGAKDAYRVTVNGGACTVTLDTAAAAA